MKKPNWLTLQRALFGLMIVAVLIAIIPVATFAAPPQQNTLTYIVQPGDTLFAIAQRFGSSVQAIMATNNLTSYALTPGQQLTIPLNPNPNPNPNFACTYTVQYRDTLYSIAYRYGTTWYALMQANYLYSPYYLFVGQVLRVPCATPAPTPFPTYTVQAGDNLFRIAIKYSTSIYAISLVNGICNPNWVFAGQTLVIPYPGSVVWPPVPTVTQTPYPFTPGLLTPTFTPTATATPSGPTATTTTAAVGTPNPNPPAAVVMTNLLFVPQNVTISKGGSVLWKNADGVNHTVVSGTPNNPSGLFKSSALTPGQSFTFSFPNAGTFPYYDETYGASMTGLVTVQ